VGEVDGLWVLVGGRGQGSDPECQRDGAEEGSGADGASISSLNESEGRHPSALPELEVWTFNPSTTG
jgi:hypothetical protein